MESVCIHNCKPPSIIHLNMRLFLWAHNVPPSTFQCDDHIRLFEKKEQETGNICSNPGETIHQFCNLVGFSHQNLSSLRLLPSFNPTTTAAVWLCSPRYFHFGQNWWRSAWSGSGCPSAQDTCLKLPESGRGWGTCSACDAPCERPRQKYTQIKRQQELSKKTSFNYRINRAALDQGVACSRTQSASLFAAPAASQSAGPACLSTVKTFSILWIWPRSSCSTSVQARTHLRGSLTLLRHTQTGWHWSKGRLLTWCRRLGQSRRRQCGGFPRFAGRRTRWCPGKCSCWSRRRDSRPTSRPVDTKHRIYSAQKSSSTNPPFRCSTSVRTLFWQIHLSSMLKPTCSGMTWKICSRREGGFLTNQTRKSGQMQTEFTWESDGNGWCSSTSSPSSRTSEPRRKEKHRRKMMTMTMRIAQFCNEWFLSRSCLQVLHQLTLVFLFFLVLWVGQLWENKPKGWHNWQRLWQANLRSQGHVLLANTKLLHSPAAYLIIQIQTKWNPLRL